MSKSQNRKCSCFAFITCQKKAPLQQISINQIYPDENQVPQYQSRTQNQTRILTRATSSDPHQFEIGPTLLRPIKKIESNIQKITQYKMEDIECCDFLPQDRDERYQFQYYCPICLRYFNHILQSKCCQNYICHFCVDDLLEKEKKSPPFQAGCPYTCEGKFILVDVNPSHQVKRYSDSQYMSYYSNAKLSKHTPMQVTAGGPGGLNKENLSPLRGGADYGNTGFKYKFQGMANTREGNFPRLTQDDQLDQNRMMMSDAMAARPALRNMSPNIPLRNRDENSVNSRDFEQVLSGEGFYDNQSHNSSGL